MSMQISKSAYEKLIKEDIEWLLSNTKDSLERRHIVEVLNYSPDRLYASGSSEIPKDLDFEQELYKHFGQVKDFTLGMRIGQYFYNLCKEQMMKEAVEGEVIKTDKHTSVRYKSFYGTYRYFYGIADKQFKPGDKGHIIFVKEEGK